MKTERLLISKVDIKNNKLPYGDRKVPDYMPSLHPLVALVGSRGQGKTTRICEWLLMYDAAKSYDKVFVISPTFTRDPKTACLIEEPRNFTIEVIPGYTEEGFKDIMAYMVHEVDEYKKYLKELEAWKRFLKCKNIDSLSNDDIALLYGLDFEAPKTIYKHGFPSFCVVVDDCVADKKMFSPTMRGAFVNFILLHRHHSCTVIMASQVLTNGIPRGVRGNVSCWILFDTKSDSLKASISEELASKATPQEVMEAWTQACQKPHDFLFVDYDSKDRNRMFKQCWDNQILLETIQTTPTQETQSA